LTKGEKLRGSIKGELIGGIIKKRGLGKAKVFKERKKMTSDKIELTGRKKSLGKERGDSSQARAITDPNKFCQNQKNYGGRAFRMALRDQKMQKKWLVRRGTGKVRESTMIKTVRDLAG